MTRWLAPVLLGALLAGCAPTETIPAGPVTSLGPVPAASPPAATTPPATAAATAAPTIESVVTSGPTTRPDPACRAADLVVEGERNAKRPIRPSFQAGTVYDWTSNFWLLNHGKRTCTLRGWPRLPALIGSNIVKLCMPGETGPSCGQAIDKTTRHPLSVVDLPGQVVTNVLPAGGRAEFSVLWIASDLMLPGTCVGKRTEPPVQLHVQVPADETPLVLDEPTLNPCDYEVGVLPFGIPG